ncbi:MULTISPECIES: hypothetical protein [Yersinia]|nr:MULTISPECIES: hypothetical protein [Yersinia]OWF83372.1 hypothetical protein B4907_11655 [Yersinia kristensenii]CND49365.1 Uncharacterised protein [Yersinia pseudotuberculosis]CNI00240.1 Uncharacterised protein [Yersinia frederiksenii]CQD57961.1 Uncharacterised protein [Yersinia enterocolitica]MCB5329314.1 hypothetical protein [Yersinia intermedia]
MMSKLEIPASCDDEWQREMLSNLSKHVDAAWEELDPEGHNQDISSARDIIEALREYSGY